MDGSDILSFVRNPAFYAQRPVHERLYSDFSRRTYQRKLIENLSITLNNLKKSPQRVSDTRIEDSLLLKDQASQARKQKERARHQSEELKNLRQVPEINKISKLIVTKHPATSQNDQVYVNSILTSAKASKMTRAASSESLIMSALIKMKNDDSVICSSQLVDRFRTSRKRNNSENLEKLRYLNDLRLIVSQRKNILQPEEPPNLLQMTVIDRGDYWTKRKNNKIEQARREAQTQYMDSCTFSPDITPIQHLIASEPKTRLSKSYSQIHYEKKHPAVKDLNSSEKRDDLSSLEKRDGVKAFKDKKETVVYSSLSPAQQNLSYTSGKPFFNRLRRLKGKKFFKPKQRKTLCSSFVPKFAKV